MRPRLFVALVFFSIVSCLPGRAADLVDRVTAYTNALPRYHYDVHRPLKIKYAGVTKTAQYRITRLSYVTTNGDRVPALLTIPIIASKTHPVPCLFLLHGLGSNKEEMELIGGYAASAGYATLAIDEWGQGARARHGRPIGFSSSMTDLQMQITVGIHQSVLDVRRGLDYLDNLPQIDHSRIGLLGVSLGALIGTIASGVDTRLKATVLISGGGDWATILEPLSKHISETGNQKAASKIQNMNWGLVSALLAPEDPLTFVSHIAPRPVLMECGGKDQIIVPAAAKELYDAGTAPANSHIQIDWYPDAGHVPSPDLILPVIQKWLAANL